MLEITPLLPEQWPEWKAVRLRALADAPEAFSTTLAQARAYDDAVWQERAVGFARDSSTAARLAWVDGEPCGMICAFPAEPEAGHPGPAAEMTSFWVAPERRRVGVGRALVEAILDWARGRGVETLAAGVTPANAAVITFYERLGFVPAATSQGATTDVLRLVRDLTSPPR